jgi:sec-independent protein translocase protein TatA
VWAFVAGAKAFCDSARQIEHDDFRSFAMGFGSWWHWVLLLIVVLVVFGGKGKVSDLMGDVAKGIKSFKKGLADDPAEANAEEVMSIEKTAEEPVKSPAKKVKS